MSCYIGCTLSAIRVCSLIAAFVCRDPDSCLNR